MKIVSSTDLRKWIDENEVETEIPEPPEKFSMIWASDLDPVVTQWFGVNPQWYPLTRGHEGIDTRAPNGTPILAVAPGEVYRAEPDPSSGPYGMQVRIAHPTPDGIYKTVYAHFMGLKCEVGDKVNAGDVIGIADNTGNSTGAHLHMTLKWVGHGSDWMNYGDIVNPVPYMPDLFPGDLWRLDVGGNFRTSPEVANNLIRYLGSNLVVKLTGEFIDDWWRLVYDGVVGWFWNPGYKMFPR